MGFRDNLPYLRGERDMSQAQLAQQLGVSRQSVAKWEAGKSHPEMDKLVKICDLFECSLDDLVRGDLAAGAEAAVADEAPAEAPCAAEPCGEEPCAMEALAKEPRAEELPVEASPAEELPVDAFGYDEHMRRRAWDCAVAAAAVPLGVGMGFFLTNGSAMNPLGVFIAPILVGLAVAGALVVPTHAAHRVFQREHPVIEDFYSLEEKARARRWRSIGIVGGIALGLFGLRIPGALAGWHAYPFSTLMLFVCSAAFAALLVYAVMMSWRVDVFRYNASASVANEARSEAADRLPIEQLVGRAVEKAVYGIRHLLRDRRLPPESRPDA